MLKNRLIPVLFLKNGFLVRSRGFDLHQSLGNPVTQVERYNDWDVDELIYIDITDYSLNDEEVQLRSDLGSNKGMQTSDINKIFNFVSSKCFMPLTFGGGIKNIEQAREKFELGADKIVINSQALKEPSFITKLANIFGSQAIVVSVDVKISEDKYLVYSDLGSKNSNKDPLSWCREVEDLGGGEIFLNSIDRDGSAQGYDIKLIASISSQIKIPLIACGGVGDFKHFSEGINEGGAAAVAAGNIFNFKELAYPLAKKFLLDKGLNFR